jgi:hypothetical protein
MLLSNQIIDQNMKEKLSPSQMIILMFIFQPNDNNNAMIWLGDNIAIVILNYTYG